MSTSFERTSSESIDTGSSSTTFQLSSPPPPRVRSGDFGSPIKRKPLPPGAAPFVEVDTASTPDSRPPSSRRSSYTGSTVSNYEDKDSIQQRPSTAVTDTSFDGPIRVPTISDLSGGLDSPTLPPPSAATFVVDKKQEEQELERDLEELDNSVIHDHGSANPSRSATGGGSPYAWRLQQRGSAVLDFLYSPTPTDISTSPGPCSPFSNTSTNLQGTTPPPPLANSALPVNPISRRNSDTEALLKSPLFPPNDPLPPIPPLRRSSTSAMAAVANPNIQLTNEDDSPKAGGLKSFFRWGSSGAPDDRRNSTQTLDQPSLSPKAASIMSYRGPTRIDTARANEAGLGAGPLSASSRISFAPSFVQSEYDAIEDELKAVSVELARSVKREMELEDAVERLQEELDAKGGSNKRTSDYFSDAGTPSRILDSVEKSEEDTGRVLRKAEQDIAMLKSETAMRVQEEREKRRVLELQVKELEHQVLKSNRDSSLSVSQNAAGHIKDLEFALEDAKRKLAEERAQRENFEELLSALKKELAQSRGERDNLRDEVVPQLRSRVEGLESETAELQKLMYEHTRMQQELASLRSENTSLAAAIKDRTNGNHNKSGHASTPGSPSRSGYNTPGTPPNGMVVPLNPKDRETLAERLKDVEAQRDALHQALKSLRDRQKFESKKAAEKIKALESERDRALDMKGGPGRRSGRNRDVSALRREVDRLRQRADDALEQKFVCERSLATLKMDLEKAEEETSMLRALLQEHDNLVAEHDELRDSHKRLSKQVSELKQEVTGIADPSMSLQKAYKDLKEVHEKSLERLGELEAQGVTLSEVTERERRLSEANEEAQNVIKRLSKSLTAAEVDRDEALVEASTYRKRAESLQKAEVEHMKEERSLSAQLRDSAKRVEELAAQVRTQVASNEALRERLADCIRRGEADQQASAKRINDLQTKLKKLEDTVIEAQQRAEDAVNNHEDEIRRIRETHTTQLKRLKSVTTTPMGSPKVPLSPFLKSGFRSRSGSEPMNTELLEKRVAELERALSDADNEMAEVVNRMNVAQIEVMELQNERDEAVRQTKRLKADLATERAKYRGLWS